MKEIALSEPELRFSSGVAKFIQLRGLLSDFVSLHRSVLALRVASYSVIELRARNKAILV